MHQADGPAEQTGMPAPDPTCAHVRGGNAPAANTPGANAQAANTSHPSTPNPSTPHRILIVDDHPAVREGLRQALTQFGFGGVDDAPTAEIALEKVLTHPPDLIVVDLNLPGKSGLELIADLQERGIETTMVVLTGHGSIDSAIEATRRGVFDYLLKPVAPDRLKTVVERGLERTALRREVLNLRREMVRRGRFQTLIGKCPAMLELYRMIEQIAPTNASVLITGESGTGKEVVARGLHRLSQRASRSMIAVNCAAIPASLLESELFGHEKGAYTGATAARAGCFEQADGGTLFLDEIGEMPLDLQTKLLRAIEDGRIRRVGGERETQVDVRIVSATNADVGSLRRDGRLREDLFFRLNVFLLKIPPLRERDEDIPLLAEHFLQEFRDATGSRVVGFSRAVMERLISYRWPGNVRELRNAVQRAAILCTQGEIQPEHLPPEVYGLISEPPAVGEGIFLPVGSSVAEAEKAVIMATLSRCGGRKQEAARILGISLKTLYNRLSEYDAEAGRRSEERPPTDRTSPGRPESR